MLTRIVQTALFASVIAAAVSYPAVAQDKKRVERAADLPRFSYPVKGTVEQLVRDAALFEAFARDVRRDTESVLAQYDIGDKSIERQLLNVIALLDFLEGRNDEALKRAAQVRALQEKPSDKLLSGLQTRAMVAASKAVPDRSSDAWRKAVGDAMLAELSGMPYEVVANDVKGAKGRFETTGEALIMGGVREVLQPTVAKTGALSSDLAPRVVSTRYALLVNLPLKQTLVDTYSSYLAANRVEKPEIWAARSVELSAGFRFSPVKIAVWDSGVDTAIFSKQLVRDTSGKPAIIAFDKYSDPSTGELMAVSSEIRGKLPRLQARMKGFSDLQSNVDSSEASEVKQYLSSLKADEYKGAIEDLIFVSHYSHGTHVAGIAMAGNPYASLVVARLSFGHTLLPDPCPSRELAEKDAKAMQAYVDFLKANGVRVVNMSWGGSVLDIEQELEKCGTVKEPDQRKKLAREYFDIQKAALTRAFQGAPDILFVTSAGNSNANSTYNESIPAAIALPNLITVGAVDHAGEEASFTSYGPTVVVHASGYQVDSYVPGGSRVAISGTSMSSPQVTNLAGKMLAVNPALKPQQVIAIIRETSEKSADGRRTLIHPANAIAMAQKPVARKPGA